MSLLWNTSPTPTFSANGQFASGAQVFFYLGGTSTPLIVFADAEFTQEHPVPVIADQNGVFPSIYIPYGAYRRRIQDQNGALISDADNIDNPAPPTSGGGGVVVTQDQLFQTGDLVARVRSGIMQGFVRLNGLTIGSAVSGATELASSATQDLYLFNWNNFDDTQCPVGGGRGANAISDFNANKVLGLINASGAGFAGADNMGAGPAGRLQATTTCTTNGTTTVVVVLTANIAVGDIAIVNGVDCGPIVSINGTTVVLTNIAAGAGAGKTFRSSPFTDAEVPGYVAGNLNVVQTSDNLGVHNHFVNDPGHSHQYDQSVNGPLISGGFVQAANTNFSQQTGGSQTGITLGNGGGGKPLSILQATLVGTWYQKL